jgi:hypothetical protein
MHDERWHLERRPAGTKRLQLLNELVVDRDSTLPLQIYYWKTSLRTPLLFNLFTEQHASVVPGINNRRQKHQRLYLHTGTRLLTQRQGVKGKKRTEAAGDHHRRPPRARADRFTQQPPGGKGREPL